VIPRLADLVELGVTAVEIMAIAQFPGGRNWGCDGTHPFAPQNTYGGPLGFQRLVDACHAAGLAVVLDVVYNHSGPEGCYFREFGPYFTDRYKTSWGEAINYDGAGSDAARRSVLAHVHVADRIRRRRAGARCRACHLRSGATQILREIAAVAGEVEVESGRPSG
jgi:maltooligosyltrehalose trehalohydrolase